MLFDVRRCLDHSYNHNANRYSFNSPGHKTCMWIHPSAFPGIHTKTLHSALDHPLLGCATRSCQSCVGLSHAAVLVVIIVRFVMDAPSPPSIAAGPRRRQAALFLGQNTCGLILPFAATCKKVPAVGKPEDTFIYDENLDETEARKALLGSNEAYVALHDARSA